jgi:hypothetical protein
MTRRSTRKTVRSSVRATLTLLLALLSLGSPWVATSAASNAGGADKPKPNTFGDCKNSNTGVHNGYDCEEEEEEEEEEQPQ